MNLTQEDLQAIASIVGDTVEEKISGLREDVQTLKADVAELKVDMANMKADVAGLKIDVVNLKSDVAELKTNVSVLQIDVAELKDNYVRLDHSVSDLNATMTSMQQEMKIIRTTQENDLLPRLRHIEDCYLEASYRLLTVKFSACKLPLFHQIKRRYSIK